MAILWNSYSKSNTSGEEDSAAKGKREGTALSEAVCGVGWVTPGSSSGADN